MGGGEAMGEDTEEAATDERMSSIRLMEWMRLSWMTARQEARCRAQAAGANVSCKSVRA